MLLHVTAHIFNERPFDLHVLHMRKWNVDENGGYKEEAFVGRRPVFTGTKLSVRPSVCLPLFQTHLPITVAVVAAPVETSVWPPGVLLTLNGSSE